MNGSRLFRIGPALVLTIVCSAGLTSQVKASHGAGRGISPDLATAADGAVITASSEVGRLRGKDHTASATIDGKIGPGYWCTAFDSKPPHWLEVNLGGMKQFDEVVLHVYERSHMNSCRIERWDGNAWAAVGEVSSMRRPAVDFAPKWEFSNAPSGVVRCRFPTVSSDRVRLWFGKDSAVRLYEIEVLEAREEPAETTAALPRLKHDATLVRIAFGRRESGVQSGWIPLAADTGYSPEQGFGWVGPCRRVDCDRGGGAPFARAFVAGWGGEGRLRLNLPAGHYVAAVFATDFALPVRPFYVEGAGLSAGRPLTTVSPGAWDVRRFRVETGANGLEIAFRGDTAWLANALVIAPESNLNALLIETDRLERELALGSPEWMENRTLVPAAVPEEFAVSETDRGRGYVLFITEPAEQVFPHTRPDAEQMHKPLTLEATPGEAAVGSLGLVPLGPLFQMRLDGSDLAGPGGARIPASALDLRVVRCWPQIDKTPAGRGKVRVIPELLEPQDRHAAVCSPAGATRQYWIIVRVPQNAAAGEYRGELRFMADGVPPASVPLELTVLPFRLQTPPEKTFFMYSIFEDLSDDEIRGLLADMREHGMNSLAPDLVGRWSRTSSGEAEFDLEPLRRVLRLAKEAGFNRPMPWHASGPLKGIDAPEGSEQWNATLADLLRRVRGVQEEVGGQQVVFYPVDEPFGNEERLTLAERAMHVARQTGVLRTYCTPAEKDIARLGELLDVRCYAIGTVQDTAEAAVSSRKAGADFWWYTNAARELPCVRRYVAGVWFWGTGADGQGYWVYQSRWRRTRAFQDLEGDLHAHDYAAYPDVDGPIPTIQWECIRMGIDDARYLYTLEAAIAAHPKTPQAAAAERFLADLRRGLPKSARLPDDTWILYDSPWEPEEFSRLRREIVQHPGGAARDKMSGIRILPGPR